MPIHYLRKHERVRVVGCEGNDTGQGGDRGANIAQEKGVSGGTHKEEGRQPKTREGKEGRRAKQNKVNMKEDTRTHRGREREKYIVGNTRTHTHTLRGKQQGIYYSWKIFCVPLSLVVHCWRRAVHFLLFKRIADMYQSSNHPPSSLLPSLSRRVRAPEEEHRRDYPIKRQHLRIRKRREGGGGERLTEAAHTRKRDFSEAS